MKYRLKKVAVLGSGVMGSGIACHLANVGMDVLLLDLVPTDAKSDKASRNALVNTALQNAIKSKPAPLYDKAFSKRIQTGNFEDDFEKDW
jgi:3-hydroxyacyl-CoA dehydrogenase